MVNIQQNNSTKYLKKDNMIIKELPNYSRLIIDRKTFFGLRIGVNAHTPFIPHINKKYVFELDFFIIRLWINF